MRIFKGFAVGLLAAILVMGAFDASRGAEAAERKLTVVCSLFPQYDFVRQIAGDRAAVQMLLPPGVESHSFEPRPSDMRTLNEADLFVFTGKYMEPWAERIVQSLDNKKLIVVDASQGIELQKEPDHEDHDENGETHHMKHHHLGNLHPY